jgi:hypothetical protein
MSCQHWSPSEGFAKASLYAECPWCEIERLRSQMAWLEAHVFQRRWMPPIGSPFTWEMVGPYRHALRAMQGGENLDQAIELAMKRYPEPQS